jgi:hypothetical protein
MEVPAGMEGERFSPAKTGFRANKVSKKKPARPSPDALVLNLKNALGAISPRRSPSPHRQRNNSRRH